MKNLLFTLLLSLSFYHGHSQLAWLKLADYPGIGMVGSSYFSINGKGYMGLGFSSTAMAGTAELFEYDPVLNTWSQKANLPVGVRYACVSLAINNKGYIICGYKGGVTKEVWEYDPATNQWAQKTNFPGVGRTNAAGFVIGNKGYVGTGYSGVSYADLYEFDPVANSWTQKANFGGSARNTAGAFSIGNKGYMGMGNATGSVANYNDFFEYDPSSNTWTQKADFPITYIDCPSTYSTTSDGYVLCGYYYQSSGITHNPLNTLYKYDPVVNEWSLVGTFRGLPRGYAGSFSIGNDIYIGGGSQSNDGDGNLMLSDFWKLSNGLTLMQLDPTGNSTDFTIYPNPTSDLIYIETGSEAKHPDHIRIYDSGGKMVMDQKLDAMTKAEINVSSLKAGVYFTELITKENEVLDGRFIKK